MKQENGHDCGIIAILVAAYAKAMPFDTINKLPQRIESTLWRSLLGAVWAAHKADDPEAIVVSHTVPILSKADRRDPDLFDEIVRAHTLLSKLQGAHAYDRLLVTQLEQSAKVERKVIHIYVDDRREDAVLEAPKERLSEFEANLKIFMSKPWVAKGFDKGMYAVAALDFAAGIEKEAAGSEG